MLVIALLSLFAFSTVFGLPVCPSTIDHKVVGDCKGKGNKGVDSIKWLLYECKVTSKNCPSYTKGSSGGGHPVTERFFLAGKEETTKAFPEYSKKLGENDKLCTYAKDCVGGMKSTDFDPKGDGTSEIHYKDGSIETFARRQHYNFYHAYDDDTSRSESFTAPSQDSNSMMYGVMIGIMIPGLMICLCIGCLIVLGIGSICGYAIAKSTVSNKVGGYHKVDHDQV